MFRHCSCPPGVLHPAGGADHALLSPDTHPTSANAPAVVVVKLGTVTVSPLWLPAAKATSISGCAPADIPTAKLYTVRVEVPVVFVTDGLAAQLPLNRHQNTRAV